ncbi:hypothetical protein FXV77_10635 [Sphingobacterium phlebotomi]|uniref:Peptidase S74 domain-containing protein n=1 Tax=Sphingobacterium phlebotomi TaxID=2605433 RepID=A0A5D4H745_9SPHI|nr:hypothetical protein [Sphingobacterium phlebotomi]TYR36354.1 hypothetical protein FXV77_10635 [Sphingobacterium phlebotomi]
MKLLQLLTAVVAFFMLTFVPSIVYGQTTYTGVFRSPTNTSTYHQFIREGSGAAVYINQVATNQPILRLSSGTATANQNVVMTVQNDGSVGIGTISPQAKLAVNGNILAKEIKIKTDISVPDYVFEDTYDLPSLSSIERYVKVHKHLPEVPSAKDIEKDGLDLAEMNLLLLKKVEELTLHLIEKEKEVTDLKNGMLKVEERIYRLENKN